MILQCTICDLSFAHSYDLKKHNQRKHEFETSDDLNRTISSVKDLELRRLVFPVKKRKSIFDGVDVREFKKHRSRPPLEVEKIGESHQKFILTFNCKKCSLFFTKFGEFKRHTTESHENSEQFPESESPVTKVERNFDIVKSVSEPLKPHKLSKKRTKEGKSLVSFSCQDCSERFFVRDEFKKPFSLKLQQKLLHLMPTHFSEYPGFVRIHSNFPVRSIFPRSVLKLGEDQFIVGELKGEGGFAKVYSATWMNGPVPDVDSVLKVQKPANDWEWYILNELQNRLNTLEHPVLGPGTHWRSSFMSSPRCYTYDDGSVIVSDLQKYGTLLDMINITTTADKDVVEPLAVHLMAEILGLVEILHAMDFIHADLKPDNFMVRDLPGLTSSSAIQIIDFGKTIDLKTIPAETVFDDVVETSGLKSVEMRERRPWRHHIDYFGVAAVAYCLLFGQYMEVSKMRGRWAPRGSYKRWWKTDFWKKFFDEFLNLQGADKKCLPSLTGWRQEFLDLFQKEDMSAGLVKARGVLERKCLARRRRTL